MRKRTPGRLLGPLPLVASLAYRVQAGGVTWISPSAGDVYKSGDTIVGQWTAHSSFSSPSFSLCISGSNGEGNVSSGNCGSAVWPLVEENGSSNLTHLSLPITSSAAAFYLQMSDEETGESVSSPSFSLSPASLVPMSSAHFPVEVPATAVPQSGLPQSSVSSSIQPLPDFNEISRPAPTAAYAVPLSLVAAVLLVAGALSAHHRRKLQQELTQDVKQSSRPSYQRASGSYTRFPERRTRGSERSFESRASTPTASVAGSYDGPKYDEDAQRPVQDDRRSLYSVASLKRQPMVRRVTREPFYRNVHPSRAAYDRRRPAKMAAGAFRAGISPVVPQLSRLSSVRSDASTIRKEKARANLDRTAWQDANGGTLDAASVVERYLYPSPRPGL
ncbi:hypothetical protein DAEQUDRAFT_767040 [Daedalea quercina L-15889]|uniref:Uncharacterized protein n=1 Tax=Daedalea quercina L-15889 TaxID=1314783 RepID=A0A165P2L4_9APHY|nr:hypothetical protein DAEQUDRAFT_767040 [Daedalea quercina L-15889]